LIEPPFHCLVEKKYGKDDGKENVASVTTCRDTHSQHSHSLNWILLGPGFAEGLFRSRSDLAAVLALGLATGPGPHPTPAPSTVRPANHVPENAAGVPRHPHCNLCAAREQGARARSTGLPFCQPFHLFGQTLPPAYDCCFSLFTYQINSVRPLLGFNATFSRPRLFASLVTYFL
jgi:hypothetical protein